MATSNGLHKICFETDRKSLVDALATSNVLLNEFKDVISQCRNLLLDNFDFECRMFEGKRIRFPIVLLELSYLILSPIFSMMYHLLYTL